MNKNSHSIQRVFLEIETPSMVMANAIKNSLAMFVQEEVIPIFEKHFNLVKNIDNQIIQIEKLEINIQSIIEKNDISFSKNDIKNQIEKEVQKVLNDLQKNTKNEDKKGSEILTISHEDKELKTLLYFIENGSMPWWVSTANEVDFLKKINSDRFKNDVFRIPFNRLIQQKKVQNRIINQFSNEEITFLSSAVLGSENQQKAFSKNNLIQFLNQKTHSFKTAFWQLIFDFWIEKNQSTSSSFIIRNKLSFHRIKCPLKILFKI